MRMRHGKATSVYLDQELVEAAQALNLNISHVVQAALREALERRIAEIRQAVVDGQVAQQKLERLNGIATHAESEPDV
jgi:post-segregation antitoxin (ccd killing protein)